MRATYFAVPTLFGIAADMMAFAAFIMQSKQTAALSSHNPTSPNPNGTYGVDLLRILRVPSTPHPARVHRELVSATAAAYCHVLGWCETCMRDALAEPDAGVNVVFGGRSSSTGILNGFVVPETNMNVGSPELSANAIKFPCEHFLWRS
jgi:hypothetical protein